MTERHDLVSQLAAARGGSQEALGALLEVCRSYLLLVARRELHPGLRAKGGASDLVQLTVLDALRDFPRFQGDSEEELLAWLRRLLLNNLTDFTRRYRQSDKRDVGREIALGSTLAALAGTAADTLSPSRHAMAREQSQALEQALLRLPANYRQVIQLRYCEEMSFEAIGLHLGLSENAARKLWLRAVKRLQLEMGKGHEP